MVVWSLRSSSQFEIVDGRVFLRNEDSPRGYCLVATGESVNQSLPVIGTALESWFIRNSPYARGPIGVQRESKNGESSQAQGKGNCRR